MKLTRRELVLSTTAGIVSSKAFGQTKPHIFILGAGLSGLSSALQLARKGFTVTIIEARDRIGGRVLSLRKPFRDGQYVELGGETIGDGYKRFLGYADEFGIKYEAVSAEIGTGGTVADLQKRIATSAVLKGKLYPAGSTLDSNPYNLSATEAAELPPTLLIKHIVSMAAEVRANPAKLAEYDAMSLAAALRKRGVSDEMIRLMNISLNYNSIETVSMGGILWESRRRASVGTKAIRVIGGNDQLPAALYQAVLKAGVKVVLESKVTDISWADARATVTFQNKKRKSEKVVADKIICTIPFSVLRNVRFTPSLPQTKQRAINELSYTHITKVFLQAKRSEWDSRNLGSSVWTDTPCERIFNAAGKKGDERGIFTIWSDGIGATEPEKLSDDKRIVWGKKMFGETLPFMRSGIESGATKSWTNDEFVRGAYSHFTVGQLTALQPHIKTPVGQIYFAGEHTAENAPGMEGALESAERVVAEIVKADK